MHDLDSVHTFPDSFISANILLLLRSASTRIQQKRRAVRLHLKTLSRVETFERAMNPMRLNERQQEKYYANSKTCLGVLQVLP